MMQRHAFFPPELIHDVPHLTMTGSTGLHVEQHRGLIGYQPEEIVFRTGCGLLTVLGSDLQVLRYTASEADLSGRIDAVSIRSDAR